MEILVPFKRVIDYTLRPRVKTDDIGNAAKKIVADVRQAV